MEIYERIRLLRKEHLHLSQADFGKMLGVSRDVIKNIELNILAKPEQKEPLYKLICKEWGVNEVWLRTGDGDMFEPIADDDRFALNLGKLSVSQNVLVRNAINALAETEPEKLKYIEEFMRKCLGMDD